MRRLWLAYIPALIAIHSFQLCCAYEGNDADDNNDDFNYDDDQWGDYIDQTYVEEDDDIDYDWYFDDPYFEFPEDDAVVAEMKAALKAVRKEEQRIKEERKEQMIRLVSAGSCVLFGLILGTFCTSILLYYGKKTALLIRYDNEGIVVDAKILASEPNTVGTEQEKTSTTLTNKSKSRDGNDFEQAIHDNYSILSDDDDSNFGSYSLGPNSSSKGSSSIESAAASEEDSQRDGNNMKNMATTSLNRNRNQSEERKTMKDFESVWKETDQQHIPPTQRFIVVVEYKHPEFSSRIRKRLFVMGNDIKRIESKEVIKNKILLYVLKGSPKSGQCCGEIHRALKWNRQLFFVFLLSFFIVLTMATVLAASKLLSKHLFWIYLAVFLLLVLLEITCLSAAVTNLVAKQYLNDGRDLPLVMKVTNASFEKKELDTTLKHGVSFV